MLKNLFKHVKQPGKKIKKRIKYCLNLDPRETSLSVSTALSRIEVNAPVFTITLIVPGLN